MAVLSRDEARRERAGKHAKRVRICPLCAKRCHGNGGWSSHKRAHCRRANVTVAEFYQLYRAQENE